MTVVWAMFSGMGVVTMDRVLNPMPDRSHRSARRISQRDTHHEKQGKLFHNFCRATFSFADYSIPIRTGIDLLSSGGSHCSNRIAPDSWKRCNHASESS